MRDYLSEFVDFVNSEFEDEELKDIIAYGIDAVGCEPWIYYEDASKFYNDNLELVENAFSDLCFDVWDMDVSEGINLLCKRDKYTEWNSIKQFILYALIEYSANYLIGDEDNDRK